MRKVLLDEYLGHLQAKGRSRATLRAVCSDLKGFQTWWEQTYQRPFSTEIVAARDIQRWRRVRQQHPEDCRGPLAFLALEAHYSLPHIASRLWEIIEEGRRDECWEELHQFVYRLSVNEFDRRAVNRRLKQYATGDDEWRWP